MTLARNKLVFPTVLLACLAISACSDSDNSSTAQPAGDTSNPLDDTAPAAEGEQSIVQSEGSDTPSDVESEAPAIETTDVTPPPETVVLELEPPVDGQPVDGQPVEEQPVEDAPLVVLTPQPTGDAGPVVAEASALGADTSEDMDDSPTQTETLSLQGPSIKDESRGAGPPSVPTGLTRLLAAENWVEFSWAPSSDDQAVKAYEIYRDDQLIATVSGDTGNEHDLRSWLSTSFIDCNFTRYANCVDDNLQPQTGASYAYSVLAIDNEGMRSERSEPVVFSMAMPGNSSVDTSDYQLVFDESFEGTVLDRSRWKTSLPWGPDSVVNNEKQYFVNTFGSDNDVSHDPFVFTGDTLQITGVETPADELESANNQPYLSGVLTSSDYFEMTYGYVEMRAKLAPGQGLLSTFYLFNQDFYKNKPEIDIIEYLGARPDKAYQTYHYFDSNRARDTRGERHSSPTMETLTNQDLSADFHTYGVLWEPELVVWYIDGVEVRRMEGVRVSDEPMNIVAHLVLGSEWIGDPDSSSVPAVFEIDYIRAWQE
ncbi:MAG: family 16 glycosylhydrolase [Granulosicoccus sp.]